MVAHILSLHQGPLAISRQLKKERGTGERRDGREEGKEGNKREMDMKEKLLVAHLEKKAERYISHQRVKTPRATCGYIHLCPSPQLASPGPMAGPRPAGRCLLSNGLRFSQTGCGSEQKGEAWARSQLERSL